MIGALASVPFGAAPKRRADRVRGRSARGWAPPRVPASRGLVQDGFRAVACARVFDESDPCFSFVPKART